MEDSYQAANAMMAKIANSALHNRSELGLWALKENKK